MLLRLKYSVGHPSEREIDRLKSHRRFPHHGNSSEDYWSHVPANTRMLSRFRTKHINSDELNPSAHIFGTIITNSDGPDNVVVR